MKRIRIFDKIASEIMERTTEDKVSKQTVYLMTYGILSIIQNHYRRRQYKQKGYTCSNCNRKMKANQICSCEMFIANTNEYVYEKKG